MTDTHNEAVFIDFSQQNEKTINFAHRFVPNEIDLSDESARIASEFEVAGKASRSDEMASIEGNINGKLEVNCHRCLQPIEVGLDINFAENFVTLESYEKSSAEHEITGADLDVSVYDGEKIDLSEIVREQILLNLPTRQLCTENCAGLCEKCGANKNHNHCSCETEEIDPRWAALKDLKSKE